MAAMMTTTKKASHRKASDSRARPCSLLRILDKIVLGFGACSVSWWFFVPCSLFHSMLSGHHTKYASSVQHNLAKGWATRIWLAQ